MLYHTDNGQRAAAIMKRGRKWMEIMWADGSKKRVQLAEERYMRPMTSKRG